MPYSTIERTYYLYDEYIHLIGSTPEFSSRGLLQRPNTVIRDAVKAENRKTLNDRPIYSFGYFSLSK